MRTHYGSFAYELSEVYDPQTHTLRGWEYKIYRVLPNEELLHSAQCSPSRDTAEREAQQIVTLYDEWERLKLRAA